MDELVWDSAGVRQRVLEVLGALLTQPASIEMLNDWIDTEDERLQHWCVYYARCQWMTGISIIDMSKYAVQEAFDNTNIDALGNIR